MRDKNKVIEDLNKFIKSESSNCIVLGTDVQKKHLNVLKYLNDLGMKLKVLIRINAMNECEYLLGKFKTGVPKKVQNLTIYVDSMNVKSQNNTPRNFNCIVVYPIDSLKGISDPNISDILNYREAEKVFWVSNHDSYDYSYLKEICDISDVIEMDNDDESIHNRIVNNTNKVERENFNKLYVDNLSYYKIEEALNSKYNLGGIYTSSMGTELLPGQFGEFTFGGHKATKVFSIKVKEEKENGKYVLLVKIKS